MADRKSSQLNEILDNISVDEKAVRLAAFDAILAIAPASVEGLAQRTGIAPSVVAGAVGRMADLGILVVDDGGLVVGSWGLTLIPTSHRLRMFEHDYYVWCAEDAVGIPAALGVDATVASSCFQCGRPVEVEIKRGEVAGASPQNVHVWIAEAEVGRSVVGST